MNIIKRRNVWFLISSIFIVIGIISLIMWGLKLGIDFSGGSLIELEFPKAKEVSIEKIEKVFQDKDVENIAIQKTGDKSVLIRTETIDKDKLQEIKDKLKKQKLNPKELRFETVGPIVSKSLTRNAIIAVIVASIAIILYIAISFRKVPKPASSFRFGIAAILALIHDLAIVIGVFAILGHFLNIEIDSLFITALLTIMGYSVHDTIVVFDRIRENLKLNPDKNFEEITEDSVVQTINRSINTSLTLLLVLFALFIFGGETIKYNFVLPLIVGVLVGTYSSIFTASPILVVWQNLALRRKKV